MRFKVLSADNKNYIGLTYELGDVVSEHGYYRYFQDVAIKFDMYQPSVFREPNTKRPLELVLRPLDEGKRLMVFIVEEV